MTMRMRRRRGVVRVRVVVVLICRRSIRSGRPVMYRMNRNGLIRGMRVSKRRRKDGSRKRHNATFT